MSETAPSPAPPVASTRRRRGCVSALVLLLAAAGAAYTLWRGGGGTESGAAADQQLDSEFTVHRGDFPIRILLNGSLDAIKRHVIECDVPRHSGDLKFTSVVDDKTEVKKGQVIAVFESDSFLDEQENLRVGIDDAAKELILAQQDLEMKKSANVSKLKGAMDSLQDAEDAFTKYRDLESPKTRTDRANAVRDAEESLAAARIALAEAEEALRDAEWQGETRVEDVRVERDRKAVAFEETKRTREKALYDQKVFKQYEYPQKLRSLQDALGKGRLSLQQAVTESEANIIQSEQKIQNLELRLRKKQKDFDENEKKISALVVRAPVDGILSHGNPNRRPWEAIKEIKVGATVRTRESFASIPDLSKFLVNVDVPESRRSQLKIGLPAVLTIPAIPELRMRGTVGEISAMATNVVNWDKNSPKIYETKISTDEVHPNLMPGITVEAEIVVETVKDVLFVPVEALYSREGHTYCRVRGPLKTEEREVQTGRSSDSYVEITSGLDEGERVMLHRKAAKQAEAATP